MAEVVVTRTELPGLKKIASGKVRDIYEFEDKLLLVATDRLSAFDVVFNEGIPGKGRVLTQLSAYWFGQTRAIAPNHLITASWAELPDALRAYPELRGRTTLCRRAEVLPIECVARGYLEGSAWKEYQAEGSVAGIALPKGLKRRSRLPEPIFTPATKAQTGHDENITFDQMVDLVGRETAERAREMTLRIFKFASESLESRGILLADTKFEFGWLGGELIVIDEMLTPDSSRYWVEGVTDAHGELVQFDKQVVRDYLETLDWDKTPPPPPLPPEIVAAAAERYMDIYKRITGQALPEE